MKGKIAIIGSGISGMLTALSLARNNIPSVVLEKAARDKKIDDPRTTSLNYASVGILKKYHIWNELQEFTSAIDDIYVIDNYAPKILHFAGKEKLPDGAKMGYMIQNNVLRSELAKMAKKNKLIEIKYACNISDVEFAENNRTRLLFENNSSEDYNLILACDGKFSYFRQMFFTNRIDKSYHQNAIVFNISHEKPHNNIAVEHFMNNGPFATLPLKSQNESSIVWTEDNEAAEIYSKMPKDELEFFVQKKIGDLWGKIKIITDVFSYPLSAHIVSKYHHKNIALIADSAHSIHPLAGQGLNLGIRDIETLVDIITRRINVGMNIDEFALSEYSSKCVNRNMIMFATMDGINTLFSNDNKSIKFIRQKGIAVLDKIPYLKNILMKKAMGD